MLSSIKGAIFDADGTLLDSMPIWDDIGSRYLKSIGRQAEDDLAQKLFPLTFDEGVDYVIDHYQLSQTPAEVSQGIFDVVEAFYADEVNLKPGTRHLLAYLAEQKVPMVVATSSKRQGIEKAFARLNIDHYFKAIFTCDEVGKGKNEPDIFLAALEALQTPKEATYVFEDALYAIQTAQKLGLATVAIYDAYSDAPAAAIQAAADYYVQDFNSLISDKGVSI